MMKLFLFLTVVFFSQNLTAQKQLIVGDITITYEVQEIKDKTTNSSTSSKTLYVKGKIARADFISPEYKQSIIYDNKTGSAVILKEVGSAKFMTTFSPQQWQTENIKYKGMSLAATNEKKRILNYDCRKVIATLSDGTSFELYYTPSIALSTTENQFVFGEIPGLVLAFEIQPTEKSPGVVYTATSVNLNPVPISKFEIPATGYRVLPPKQ